MPRAAAARRKADEELLMDLYDQPGHLIRRAQQIAVSMFHEVMGTQVTPTQYAVLRMLQEAPGIDQLTLAGLVALDTSTTAEMCVRLEAKGWIHREVMARRQRRLTAAAVAASRSGALLPVRINSSPSLP